MFGLRSKSIVDIETSMGRGIFVGRPVAIALAMAIASASAGACGMSQLISKPEKCRVIGSDKLPTEVGGAQAVCAAIESAAGQKAGGAIFEVEVRVLSASSLAAIVRLEGGQTLPEQKMAVSDRRLNKGSIDRFADAIASEIAIAIKH